ncbi:MAG: phosphoglycolate phosphatase-like HAD superfamily hydrolase [Planctomycetota bacterium]
MIFDLDGTLTRPGAIDFVRMRERVGMPEPGSILHWIEAHARSEDEAESMRAVVWEEESLALEAMELGEGFDELVKVLVDVRDRMQTAICTRNNVEAIVAFDNLLVQGGFPRATELFPVQIVRDHHSERVGRPLQNKPSPEPVHEIKHAWGLLERYPLHKGDEGDPPRYPDLIFVGDSEDDLLSGRRAGTAAAWMDHGAEPVSNHATHTFACLGECAAVLCARMP